MFVFRLHAYSQPGLTDELEKALEKRIELHSRQKLPRIWHFIDWMNARQRRREAKRQPRHEARKKRQHILLRICGVVMILMGIFLFVPGLMSPDELAVPLVAGAVSMVVGFLYLVPWKRKKSDKFRVAAKKLLSGMQGFEQNEEDPVVVLFKQDGMLLPGDRLVPYAGMDTVVETENLLLLTWEGHVTVLQKSDLNPVAHQDFIRYLEETSGLKVQPA